MKSSSPSTPSALFTERPRLDRKPTGRRVLATASALLGVGSFGFLLWSDKGDTPLTLGVPLVGLALSLALLHSRHLGAQLLARSFWWTSLVLGFLIAGAANDEESLAGIGLALGAGGALLAMGRLGIADAKRRGSFVPAAFTGALTLGLVMALADLQTLVLWGGLITEISTERFAVDELLTGVGMLASALVMLVAIVGLYRLKMWGVVLNLAANVVIATCALTVFELPDFIAYALATTAVIQLLLPLPMLRAMITRRAVTATPRRWAALVTPAVVSAMMVGAVLLYDSRLFSA